MEYLFLLQTKKRKNKASMLKMQLLTKRRVFLVKVYYKIRSYLEEKEAFRGKCQDKEPPINRTIWKQVKGRKKKEHVLNINKGRSGIRKK